MPHLRDHFGVVLAATITALVVTIALPDGRYAPTTGLLLQGSVLLLALRAAPPSAAGRLAQVASLVALVAVLAAALGGVPGWLVLSASAVFLTAAIVALARGAFAILARDGVTLQVVGAALSTYLLAGLLFATVIGAIAGAADAAYFAHGGDASPGDRVYYSFAVLTTTGFGDFTPALPIGRALAVTEMLVGQIYLVTVVGLLVGNLRPRDPATRR
jgi:hypothetical protein